MTYIPFLAIDAWSLKLIETSLTEERVEQVLCVLCMQQDKIMALYLPFVIKCIYISRTFPYHKVVTLFQELSTRHWIWACSLRIPQSKHLELQER